MDSKIVKRTLLIVFTVVLLFIPLIIKLDQVAMYYVIVITGLGYKSLRELLVWDKKLDERFYKRWSKVQERGYWTLVIIEGIRSLPQTVVIVFLGQFIGNGRTPLEIITKLSQGQLIFLAVMLLFFHFVLGIFITQENDKRFSRINWQKRHRECLE